MDDATTLPDASVLRSAFVSPVIPSEVVVAALKSVEEAARLEEVAWYVAEK